MSTTLQPPAPAAPMDPADPKPPAGAPPHAPRDAHGLAFTQLGGPLVVVCGLHGGAGTSTLAHTLAVAASHESSAPVLLCETDSAAGDQARLTVTQSAWSLSELAYARHHATPPSAGPTIARAGPLRVIATGPRGPLDDLPDDAVSAFVDAARARHGLTVVDVATIRAPDARALLAIATHIIWTAIVRPGVAALADSLLSGPLAPPTAAHTTLAARGARHGRRRDVRQAARQLRSTTAAHCDQLIFVADDAPTGPLAALARPLHATR